LKGNENLTPDERARLMTNFRGYDIAPDMVRLSRANMYLHGFPNPVIYEYDALTSEERWDERCDVIMANPPFMTPKGGIRPHNRFSIKAKRSEVLFVDYIAEHLNPGGRAGIIVPDGIISTVQNSYQQVRKMLVEDSLWCVVSLPGGCFNPYSGVKTSILFLDRNMARRTDDILFVKIEADGFDLGAQRRQIDSNDLPAALSAIKKWKTTGRTPKDAAASIVGRKRILEATDYSLSPGRYAHNGIYVSKRWATAKLKDVVLDVKSGFACGSSAANGEGIPHLRPMNITTGGELVWEGTKYISEGFFADKVEYSLKQGDILFNNTNSKELVGKTCFVDRDMRAAFSNHLTRIRTDRTKMLPRFLALLLREMWRQGVFLDLCHKWVGQAGINNTVLSSLDIPLPPIAVQKDIMEEMDAIRQDIEMHKKQIAELESAMSNRLTIIWNEK
jgi:type I restriction enzyme M protein